jgi:hypothetical protein
MQIFLETTNEITYKKKFGILSLIGYIGFSEWSERMGRSCTSVFSRHIQKSVRSSQMLQEEIEVGKYLYSTDTSIRKTGKGVTTFTGDAGERHAEPHCRQMTVFLLRSYFIS